MGYYVPMTQTNLLPADTEMGAVTLWVADLDMMIRYYRDGVGLQLLSHIGSRAVLGVKNLAILILEHKPMMKHASPHEAGLFHTAILFPTQAALAKAVDSVARQYPGTFTGSADHLVSKAFYFNDPEGNGVELYWDRDRSEWSWIHGSIEMDTIFLDPNAFLSEHLTEYPVEEDKKVGHVHLSVGSIAAAEEFYVKMLGFERTMNWGGSALFVSAGGYHHHMAMNTWRSKGAGKRQLALGLGKVEIVLESHDQVVETKERLDFYKLDTSLDANVAKVEDPWGNIISLQSKASLAP
jgi:catechol 2,3-dioxygenase